MQKTRCLLTHLEDYVINDNRIIGQKMAALAILYLNTFCLLIAMRCFQVISLGQSFSQNGGGGGDSMLSLHSGGLGLVPG
jgi:hypothetical protein